LLSCVVARPQLAGGLCDHHIALECHVLPRPNAPERAAERAQNAGTALRSLTNLVQGACAPLLTDARASSRSRASSSAPPRMPRATDAAAPRHAGEFLYEPASENMLRAPMSRSVGATTTARVNLELGPWLSVPVWTFKAAEEAKVPPMALWSDESSEPEPTHKVTRNTTYSRPMVQEEPAEGEGEAAAAAAEAPVRAAAAGDEEEEKGEKEKEKEEEDTDFMKWLPPDERMRGAHDESCARSLGGAAALRCTEWRCHERCVCVCLALFLRSAPLRQGCCAHQRVRGEGDEGAHAAPTQLAAAHMLHACAQQHTR
jgi:hypothetical protein